MQWLKRRLFTVSVLQTKATHLANKPEKWRNAARGATPMKHERVPKLYVLPFIVWTVLTLGPVSGMADPVFELGEACRA